MEDGVSTGRTVGSEDDGGLKWLAGVIPSFFIADTSLLQQWPIVGYGDGGGGNAS